MAFDTDSTTSYETQDTDPNTYSEETAAREPNIGTKRVDDADGADPRRLMSDPNFDDIRWLYRTSWGGTLVDKPIDDAFKNGYEIDSDESERDFRAILDGAKWEQHYRMVRKKARRDGFAVNFLILDDDADHVADDPMSDDVTVEGIHKIKTLTIDDMATYRSSRGVIHAGGEDDLLRERFDYDEYEIRPTGIVVDTDPSSPRYEEPLGYLKGPDRWVGNNDAAEVDFIHHNRVMHYVERPTVDGDRQDITYGEYEGDSILTPCYHLLRGLKKGNWALMETVFRYSGKFYHVELPEDADKEEFETASDMMQNLNAKSEVVTPHGYNVEDHDSDGQLDPRSYFDVLFEQVCAATEMTKPVLFGTQTGTVSGSETDIKNYFNKVERMRQQDITEDMRRFVEHYVRLTDNRVGEEYRAPFDVEWGPMFKLTDLDQAETLTRKMQTLSAAINGFLLTPSEARSIMKEEWAEFDANVADDLLDNAEREFIESIQVSQLGSEASLEDPSEQQGFQGSTQQQNGGGREQGETSDPSDPSALSDDVIDAIADSVADKLVDDADSIDEVVEV